MPPKKEQKKDAKQLEAEAKEEERKKLQKTLEEENSKYGIVQIFSGLELIITEWMVNSLWDNENPIFYLKECLYYQLERQGINKLFKLSEIDTVTNMMVYGQIYAKNELKINNLKATVFINLIWNLFKFDDDRYKGIDIPLFSALVQEQVKYFTF